MPFATVAQTQPEEADQNDYINTDRPGFAESSNVVGTGRFQIETGIQREYHKDSSSHDVTNFIPTLLRLGITEKLEARLESETFTWMKLHDPDQGKRHFTGFAPASLGLKYQFIEAEGVERPSVGAILRVFPPSGSGRFRSTQTTGDFRLVADWDFAPKWSLNPNIGVAAYQEEPNSPRYMAGLFATTLSYHPSKTFEVFVDMGVQAPESYRGKTSVIFDVGVAYIIGKNTQLDLSMGTGVTGETSPRPFIAAGISHRF
ncbi:MAG: transporter [Alphaproteobacteria bacterium]